MECDREAVRAVHRESRLPAVSGCSRWPRALSGHRALCPPHSALPQLREGGGRVLAGPQDRDDAATCLDGPEGDISGFIKAKLPMA